MKTTRFHARSRADFERVASDFARTLRAGDVVTVSGELGAGKTAFVRAAVRALQGLDAASSPTFLFRHTYPGNPIVEHLDFYRLDDPRDAAELGLHEAFSAQSVTFVEWPERLPGVIPAQSARVRIAGSGDAPRSVEIERP